MLQPMIVFLDGGHFTIVVAISISISIIIIFHLLFPKFPLLFDYYESTYYSKNDASMICQGLYIIVNMHNGDILIEVM